MEIRCPFRNIQELAQSVQEVAEMIEGRHFSSRPWNRFDPENTEWWIVPSSEWPAYRYGKGAFHPSVREPDSLFCGLYVEKGLDSIVAKAYPALIGRGLVMDKRWTWFAFLEGLASGEIGLAAERLAQETGGPTILYISGWYASDPTDFDPHPELDSEALASECRSPLDCGRVWFQMAGSELDKIEERCIRGPMARISQVRHLESLLQVLQDGPDIGWVWFDVYVGVRVRVIPCDEARGQSWDAGEIWRRLFRPWSQWIV